MHKKPKRVQARSARTREQIYNSALALFREKGVEASTMRAIAEHAGIAVGASYYYFSQKEELIFEYYLRLEAESEAVAQELITASTSFAKRIRGALEFKISQLARERVLVQTLAHVAADPRSSMSALSTETAPIRARVIAMLEALIEGSDVKVGNQLRPVLAKLLWFHYMGIIFFWAHDRSAEQQRCQQLLTLSLQLIE